MATRARAAARDREGGANVGGRLRSPSPAPKGSAAAAEPAVDAARWTAGTAPRSASKISVAPPSLRRYARGAHDRLHILAALLCPRTWSCLPGLPRLSKRYFGRVPQKEASRDSECAIHEWDHEKCTALLQLVICHTAGSSRALAGLLLGAGLFAIVGVHLSDRWCGPEASLPMQLRNAPHVSAWGCSYLHFLAQGNVVVCAAVILPASMSRQAPNRRPAAISDHADRYRGQQHRPPSARHRPRSSLAPRRA